MSKNNNKLAEVHEKGEHGLTETDRRLLRGVYSRDECSRAGELIYNALNRHKKISLIQKIRSFFIKQ